MKVRMSRGRALATAAIVVGGTLAVAVPAEAAVQLQSQSPPSSVKIAPTAVLKANGAGVIVTLTVRCPANEYFYANYSMTEAVGGKTTGVGGDYEGGLCTGRAQTLKIAGSASPKALQPGKAYIIANLQIDYRSTTIQLQTGRTITLTK